MLKPYESPGTGPAFREVRVDGRISRWVNTDGAAKARPREVATGMGAPGIWPDTLQEAVKVAVSRG